MEKKHEILEIGCGWGSLAIEDVKRTGCNSNLQKKELKMLAFRTCCKYTVITLSKEQLKFAEERVKDVDIQVSSHETSLVARCRRVYAHAHDYHINSISNNRSGT
ncbi:cyclopropane-fatty-acyl-phospholipid synthase [Trifolium repens]|nr:cyclopropane-fatty-acyl-phospholipid synthase [Trifolium repens]